MSVSNVTIVDDECTGCGLCETTCPVVFELDDIALVKADVDLNEYEDLIRTAADDCPVEAIQIDD